MGDSALKTAFHTATGYSNPLFTRLIHGVRAGGHTCIPYKVGERFDYVFICNIAGPYTPGKSGWELVYPNLDSIKDKIVFIDPAEYGWWTHDQVYGSEYYNAFAPLAVVSKGKAKGQLELLDFLRGKSFPYFVREKYKNVTYPKQYHAIDYPLVLEVPKKPNREEFMKRKYDLYLRWGGSHIFRARIVEKINTVAGFNIDAMHKKIDPLEYIRNTEDARVSVVCDGYGSGSFRETEVLSRCVLFMKEQCIEKHHPLTDGFNFVEYKVDYKMMPSTIFLKGSQLYLDCNIDSLLKEYMSNWDRCFKIYEAGYNHCVKHYSVGGFALYVMEKVFSHNYIIPTPVEMEDDKWLQLS